MAEGAIELGYVDPAAPDQNPDAHVLHHNNLDALIWLQSSAEAYACYVQTFELAKLRVTEALRTPPPADAPYCVFSDLDETLLDNSAYNEWLVTTGRSFNEAGSWNDYCREAKSIATPGAVEFTTWLAAQRDAGGGSVEVFYVTSRLDAVVSAGARLPGVRPETARNLTTLGFPLPDGGDDPATTHLFMKNQLFGTAIPDKFGQYRHVIEVRRRTPILWLGDNAADFDPRFRLEPTDTDVARRAEVAVLERARWGKEWLQFPNPVYGGFLQYLRLGATSALADDRNGFVAGAARLPRSADGLASQGRTTEKVRALAPWAPAPAPTPPPALAPRPVNAPPKPAGQVRLAAYNIQNVFSRARALNKDDQEDGAAVLRAVADLQALLEADVYDRRAILKLFNDNELYAFVTVRADRINDPAARSPRFFFHTDRTSDWSPAESINTAVKGRDDWSGSIVFRRDALDGPQTQALADVVLGLDADVLVLCEVEDRRILEDFNTGPLGGRYGYAILLEGNDGRGIDVAVLSRWPVGEIRTNVFTRDPDDPDTRLFGRDCLEVAVDLGSAGEVHFLCNHLKSKEGPGPGEVRTDGRRIRQSAEIARIIGERYAPGGTPRRVVVAGDLNESPTRNGANGAALGGAKTSIDAVLFDSGLANVIGDRLGPADAWTYVLERGSIDLRSQIDYLLLSPDLAAAVTNAGVERSGQPNAGPGSPPKGEEASDHAAVWCDLDL